ncbi:MAG TPA: TetR/AcrR family transcriptional regulator [Acidimicrobiales bacterium]|nr:TetR/AcrR family transcriptional regulator [Acidimicrobiales bacterium]
MRHIERRDSQTRLHILETTVALINETGSGELRVADVAKRADVGVPTIYYHFESRARLIAEAQVAHFEQMLVPFRQIFVNMATAVENDDLDKFKEMYRLYVALSWSEDRLPAIWEFLTVLADIQGDMEAKLMFNSMQHRELRHQIEVMNAAKVKGWLEPDVDPRLLTVLVWAATFGRVLTEFSDDLAVGSDEMVAMLRTIFVSRDLVN